MEAPAGKLATVTRKDSVAGGHETCLFAYDKTLQLVVGMNSWDVIWGDKGFYYMPFSAFKVFKQLGGYDANIINVDWKLAPATN